MGTLDQRDHAPPASTSCTHIAIRRSRVTHTQMRVCMIIVIKRARLAPKQTQSDHAITRTRGTCDQRDHAVPASTTYAHIAIRRSRVNTQTGPVRSARSNESSQHKQTKSDHAITRTHGGPAISAIMRSQQAQRTLTLRSSDHACTHRPGLYDQRDRTSPVNTNKQKRSCDHAHTEDLRSARSCGPSKHNVRSHCDQAITREHIHTHGACMISAIKWAHLAKNKNKNKLKTKTELTHNHTAIMRSRANTHRAPSRSARSYGPS
jgi:hypothetical protein